ncbi:pitrilysin family protein [Pseudogemmatithrix spongiicola]|uniref:Pitrilysin family protein n=1 Tax=Pseudogemmatithrix spongiicola TaxID=3062599 RepID=A0AA49Q648_9BACT|nr:pitrilysin family protein [Gemmatimonadaceae bacterium 'strain 138']WKW16538.1 pitrilysin family protein [Gemmatimonadaceae bacterium 'strain 318']
MAEPTLHLPIATHTLANGLRVVLSEDHATPIVAVNLWYHVGSANEREGRTGFAHLFEHMLFQGSANVGANEHFELVQRAGGTLNGSTWLDRTNYFETVPAHQLELALWLEADRMGRLLPAMTQEKLDTQRDVVKNERRWSVDNQPYGTWWERLPALCFPPTHPFHHSLIGSMDDLSAASLDDVAEFFRTYYTPDNAVLSIVGDFEPAAALAMVERHFGAIPRGAGRPALPPMTLPPRFGEWRRAVVEDEVAAARTFLAFRIPACGTDAWYALAVLAAVLGTGEGARLPRALVREQRLASDAGAFTFDLTKGADLLICDVTARPGVPVATALEALVAQIDRLRAEGVTPAERDRALALLEASWLLQLQSAGQRADKLSQFATYYGDAARLNTELGRYRAVDAAALHAAARDWLGEDNRASLSYVPKPAAQEAA